ncbi:MAG TPA: hypothetical protein VKE94_17875 [Gemmataceae bacterium]|nr:hypothetical protein [Gemmataceae bacterium]
MGSRLNDLMGPAGETREWLILASIRAGGYPHVAAEAYGIAADRFLGWLQRSRARKASAGVRRLAAKVREAAARARLKAEMAVFEADPRFWLRHGPGKETRHAPGWSALAKPVFGAGGDGGANLLASRELQAILTEVSRALEPYPEARAATAAALQIEEEPGTRKP